MDMTNSIPIEPVIDINNCQSASFGSKHDLIFSPETNRHIKFTENYDEKQKGKRQTLTHLDYISASDNEILYRYLAYFEEHLPKYINENFTNEVYIENYRLSTSRIHHKDDIELYHLKRIQMLFESIEKIEKFPLDIDILIIIDAFHIYVETLLQRQYFINECNTEQQINKNEVNKTEINIPFSIITDAFEISKPFLGNI